MNDKEYIRKATEMADGFTLSPSGLYRTPRGHPVEAQVLADALAAQLVRQMDELILYRVQSEPTGTFIHHEGTGERILDSCLAGNRTMNTIKAIIDSKVLE